MIDVILFKAELKMKNESTKIIFVSNGYCKKCRCFDNQPVEFESIESIAEKKLEYLHDANIIYQTDDIKLDEVTILANIKNKIFTMKVTVCTNEANRKYSNLIKRLNFDFKLSCDSNCDNCRFNNNICKIISTWLLFNCVNKASYHTHKMINIISSDFGNANLHILSKKLRISEEYLSRTVKRDFNKNFRTVINELKLYIVKEIIKQYNFSDQDIADFLGYNELTNFYRFMKKMNGISVNKFRLGLSSSNILNKINGAV